MSPLRTVAILAALALAPAPVLPAAAAAVSDSLAFAAAPDDTGSAADTIMVQTDGGSDVWLRTPFGDHLLTDADEWTERGRGNWHFALPMSYNRVDSYRLGVGYQVQATSTMYPRVGARLEYAFQRERTLYGVQVEQPLLKRGRLALGISTVRVTDHSELQQVEDLENSIAMLFGRIDYRDYFEREGYGAYLASRFGGLTTLSLHARSDDYRSLPTKKGTSSIFYRDRTLRPNPPIDEGETRRGILRLEKVAHRTSRTRAGFYHWIEFERAGGDFGGDFEYTRLLADVRSVFRLSPATTLALRMVGGSNFDGDLPVQREFTAGGPDGLRAHRITQFRGDQIALGQAEYSIGLWKIRASAFEGGVHAIAFVDAGGAWFNPDGDWDPGGQHLSVDGGLGLATAEDNLRIYFAHDLQEPDADFMISVRLQRPF